jgi:hypothetical protein
VVLAEVVVVRLLVVLHGPPRQFKATMAVMVETLVVAEAAVQVQMVETLLGMLAVLAVQVFLLQ